MSKLAIEKWWFDLTPSEQYLLKQKYQIDSIFLIYEKEFKFNLEEE